MSHQQVIQLLKSLPTELQQEVVDFIEFLAHKTQRTIGKKTQGLNFTRKPGIRKGFVNYMAADFDAPLDDFEDSL